MSTSVYSSPILSTFPFDALTTTFTPPASCSGIYTSGEVVIIDEDLACLPQGFTSSSTNYFSPGLICPAGYVTACNDNAGVSSVTTVTCCPYRDDITLGCVTPSTLSSVWETLFCTWIAPESGTTVQITTSNDGTTSTERITMRSPAGINAMGVRMVYQSSDVSKAVTTTDSDQAATTTGTTGATPTSTSGGSGSGSSNNDSSGISLGAVIAIAVVIPIVAMSAAVGIFFFIRRQKQVQRLHSREGPGGPGGLTSAVDQKGYYGAVGPAGSYYDPKSPLGAPSEVSGVGAYGNRNQHLEAVELGDRGPAVELPA
ncbi:hypothetical protein VP1G_04677 [Cytospora mali]|uniref:Uncharacterized protein n=1 Tax=Cytospora mali TaxID=578113 RepID=A0A194V0K7_CYTMA|nr:hypothetical protein VP1G_04677 [Valsa mali var. pyri (nom. inval.)]